MTTKKWTDSKWVMLIAFVIAVASCLGSYHLGVAHARTQYVNEVAESEAIITWMRLEKSIHMAWLTKSGRVDEIARGLEENCLLQMALLCDRGRKAVEPERIDRIVDSIRKYIAENRPNTLTNRYAQGLVNRFINCHTGRSSRDQTSSE